MSCLADDRILPVRHPCASDHIMPALIQSVLYFRFVAVTMSREDRDDVKLQPRVGYRKLPVSDNG